MTKEWGIATLATGTSYHAAASGVAKLLTEHLDMKVVPKPFDASTTYMPMAHRGDVLSTLTASFEVGWAYQGKEGFEKTNIRLLMRGHNVGGLIHMATRKDTGIKSMRELRGKRIPKAVHKAHWGITTAALDSVGLTWDDVKPVPVPGPRQGYQALREGTADASFAGSCVAAGSTELNAAVGGLVIFSWADIPAEKFSEVPKEIYDRMRKILPGTTLIVHPAGRGFCKEDFIAIDYPTYWTASAKMNDETAYQSVKAVWENNAELHPLHVMLKRWVPEQLFEAEPAIPYHTGAVRFWKEIGRWTPALEKRQQELLKAGGYAK